LKLCPAFLICSGARGGGVGAGGGGGVPLGCSRRRRRRRRRTLVSAPHQPHKIIETLA